MKRGSMGTVNDIADEYWAQLKHEEPYYAVISGEPPETIEPIDEATTVRRSDRARGLLDRLDAVEDQERERAGALEAVLRNALEQQAARAEQLWHVHPTAPYQSYAIGLLAQQVIAPQQGERRDRLTGEFAAMIGSIAELVRQQRERGIALPAVAVAGARATWTGLRAQLPALLGSDAVDAACAAVLEQIDESAAVAGQAVGLAQLPGGEQVYRSWVRRETTMDVEPEQLHQLGLEQCAELAERMAQTRARLGGPADEDQARDWVRSQPHLYADEPDQVAAIYRRHVAGIAPKIGDLFAIVPHAAYDVRRLDPAAEAGMTFGYYQPPTEDEPLGLYRFNGSELAQRSQLTAAALILHELVPGHHFHLARQRENADLHPLQQHSMGLAAFNEGWGEYASGLGWELGAYQDWDAYGRLAHERFTAQRLVVDTALNLGWWDLDKGRDFMRANTLESDLQIATETIRYSTDLPAQALAYRTGFVAFQQARESVSGLDVRDIHEAMLGAGAVPLPHMQQRVRALAA